MSDLRDLAERAARDFPDGPNPRRIGACPECGSYRADGRPPYLHREGCSREGDVQVDRFVDEFGRADLNGPTLH